MPARESVDVYKRQVLGQAANILGIMFVPSLTKRIGKKKTYFMAMFGATILSVLFYFLPKDFIWGILCLQVLICLLYTSNLFGRNLATGRRRK